MEIQALIINGRHGGLMFGTRYSPIVRLPITQKEGLSIGEVEDGSVKIGDHEEYKECFRSIDGKIVIYSENGSSEEIRYILPLFKQTYPIRLF